MTQKLTLLVLLWSFTICVNAQKKSNSCIETPLVISILNKYHLTPIDLNETTSEQIFNDYIRELDPDNSIFTIPDIISLSAYKTQLLGASSADAVCKFIKLTTKIYTQRIHISDSLITGILQNPFNFKMKDSITFNSEYFSNFVTNDIELKNRLLKTLKYETLNNLFSPEGDNGDLYTDGQQLQKKEAETRKKIGIKKKRMYQRILDYPFGIEEYLTGVFLNTIANRYDPHSMYFSPSGKAKFQASLSKDAKGFGFSIIEGKIGEVEIDYLVPGGPAWKSNLLNKGDMLVQVKWPKGEALDLAYSSAEDVDDIISNSVYDDIVLTVKKTNGNLIDVALTKEIINVEKNSITGYILKGDKNIGYISLPAFYTDFTNQSGLGCANDVALEILKLQKENIEGLIMDLRNNGGGSLQEAIGLTGLFIDEGPLFMSKMKDQKPVLLKDMNRGRVYSGPLIVIVNGFSASASELVTAGLRDYNRALITGSTTFGKAIAQVTFPLDTTNMFTNNPSETETKAFLHISIEKLYRLNGESHQKIGIRPDIELPDLNLSFNFRESTIPYAINSDRVDKKIYYTPLPALPLAELAQKSKERVDKDNIFVKIKSLSDSIQSIPDREIIIQLDLTSFREREEKYNTFKNSIEQIISKETQDFKVVPSSYDAAVLQADSQKKKINDTLLKLIQDDIYIEEVYQQMLDLINLIK